MKLIIDIPEDSYERVMNPDKFYRDIDGEKIRWAVYKGTPIPDNATNGDVIKALFHDIKYEEGYVYVKSNTYKNVIITVREDWWNAQYQKGGKE